MASAYRTKSKCPKSDTFVPHSIPVPDLYRHAKNILRQHLEGSGTVKKLVFEGRYRNYPKLFAVVQKAVEQFDELQKVLKDLGIFANHPQLDPYLATILASQIVERGNDIPGRSKPILAMNSYKCKLLDNLKKVEGIIKTDVLPTYVRINVLKTTPKVIHEELRNYGFLLLDHDWSKLSYKNFLEIVDSLEKSTYITDYHIPDLLVFPPRQAFWHRQIFGDSLIIVQDKASCLPAFLSGVQPGMNVIDACAAPGNKTTHLASFMKMQGSLTAVEKDFKRYETLKKLIEERGASLFINTVNSDFTHIDSMLFENTEVILVDPSCSSSGTDAHNEEVSSKRVDNLAFFQLRILEHALSFPNVQTVLYSTCSVNEKENEGVVEEALKKFERYFKLSKLRKYLKEWQHFGSPNYECGKYCIRTDKLSDKCHGFFVAKFRRRKHPKIENIAVNSFVNSSCNTDVTEESKSLNFKCKKEKRSKVDNECHSLQYGVHQSEVKDNFMAEDNKNMKKKSKKIVCSNNNNALIESPQKKKRKKPTL